MDIITQDFVSVVASGTRVPVEQDRYARAVVSAINRSIEDINRLSDIETAIVRLDSLNDATIGLDEKYESMLHDGVVYYLEKMGTTKLSAAPRGAVSVRELKNRFHESIDDFWYQQILASQADADNSVAGLGATSY